MSASIFYGFSAKFEFGALKVPVTLKVDTPVVKKRLLFDIVDDLKEGRDPVEAQDGFRWHQQLALEAWGERIFSFPSEEPDFESLKVDYEYVLETLNTLWRREFPDGSPSEIEYELNLNLTSEKLIRGLAFAWSEEELQGEGVTELSVEQITAYDVIYWTVHVYIYTGEIEFDDAAFYEEPYLRCTEIVKHWFGFLDDSFEYGAWGALL